MPVFRNQWKALSPKDIPHGTAPQGGASVVIPSLGGTRLAMTLAALAAVPTPLHVIVVDDGNDFDLPDLRPRYTTLLRNDSGWGKASALNRGVSEVDTEFLFTLDDDMVVDPFHFTSQLRWLTADSDVVTLGSKLIVPEWEKDPARVYEACRSGLFKSLYTTGLPHSHLEHEIAQTDAFNYASLDTWRCFVGASTGMRTIMYRETGGYDETIVSGEDTEFGYRLSANGAVLIPVLDSLAWHLGITGMMRNSPAFRAHNDALLVGRVPTLSTIRNATAARHAVPDLVVCARVDAVDSDATLKRARSNVDAFLDGRYALQTNVVLIGNWPDPAVRYGVEGDAHAPIRALARVYEQDFRVTLAREDVEDVFPAPALLVGDIDALVPKVVIPLLDALDERPEGVFRFASDGKPSMRRAFAVRTAATRRARRSGVLPESVWGSHTVRSSGFHHRQRRPRPSPMNTSTARVPISSYLERMRIVYSEMEPHSFKILRFISRLGSALLRRRGTLLSLRKRNT